MTEPRGTSPSDDGDLAALRALDLALDQLADGHEPPAPGPAAAAPAVAAGPGPVAGHDVPAPAAGQVAALASLAAELREAVPAPPAGAAERGRDAFLAQAADLVRPPGAEGGPAGAATPLKGRGRGRNGGALWRRSLPLRVAALAAALVVLVAVPATAARQARPGTMLWPLRHAGQQLRVNLADDPVHRAHLRLNTAGEYLAAGAGAGEERREEMADLAEEEIREALDTLDDVAGPQAAAERARAERLLADVDALERQRDPDDSSGPGSGSEPDDDRSGGDDDEDRSGRGGGDDRSGRGGGDDSGSGSDRSGSGGRGSDDD